MQTSTWKRSRKVVRQCAALTVAGGALWLAALPSVSAQDLTPPRTIDENHPERSIPTPEQALKNPLQMGYLLMDLIARGEAASEVGDHEAAIRYYRAIAKAVPERAVSFSKLCKSHETLAQYPQALDACKQALGKGGATSEDYLRYVRLVLRQADPLLPAQIEELDGIVKHLREQVGSDIPGKIMTAQVACEIATRLEDSSRLSSCTHELVQLAPKDARTLTFQWAFALKQHDTDAARSLLASATQSGLPPAALGQMQAQLETELSRPSAFMTVLREWGLWTGISLLVAISFAVLGRKKPTLSAA